ncbi:hypothetical protein ACT453_28610, partial [Bacillus sp. D-CC]
CERQRGQMHHDLDVRRALDKTLEFEDVDFVADKIEAIIQEVNPSRIITFYPEHGIYPAMIHL